MPARMSAHLRRAAVTATMLVTLALTGALAAVSPAQASVAPLDRGPSVAAAMAAPRPAPRAPVVTPAARVLAMAAALRGRPYQYGASGPSAFDCSGFTRYVFGHALGRSLVHNAAAQYADSLKLARSAVRPGDLVFYTSGGWVYHVGIYAGGGLIWDAPHTGETVRLERIATSSWVAGRVR
jgi:cell wall-associated NlpC family hydrolase